MGSEFWKRYDDIYKAKDYDTEVAVVLPLLGTPSVLLEIGCGTGEHTRRFARHIPTVIALDMDEEAIAMTRKKRIPNVLSAHGRVEDFRTYHSIGAAVALFNVVHYLQTDYWLKTFMAAVARCLNPSSPFVFDCWNCEAVLNDPPKDEIHPDGIRRISKLDRDDRRVQVAMHGDRGLFYTVHHKLWTIEELKTALTAAGFVDICVAPWMRPAVVATPADWKIMFICERGPT